VRRLAIGAAMVAVLAGEATLLSAGPAALIHRTHHTLSGELVDYDPTTRVLTLKVKSGARTFHVAEDAQAWVGQESLPIAGLASRKGTRATVTYTDKGGEKTTRTIRFTAAPR
jgi:hypothetical protein